MFDQNDQNQQAQGIIQPTDDQAMSSVNFSVPAVDPFASPAPSISAGAPLVDQSTVDQAAIGSPIPAVDPFANPAPTDDQANVVPSGLLSNTSNENPIDQYSTSNDFSVPAVDPFANPAPSISAGAPLVDQSTVDQAAIGSPIPAVDPFANPAPTDDQANVVPASEPSSNGDALSNIKQSALQNLSPLLDKLEQSPEEKFRTTMMLIQASDDQTLVQSAYDAANAIQDEKVRAQALLDVVNEINYFTQSKPVN